MKKITTVLFDFDGTIVDTETQYDFFLDELEERLQLGIADFAAKLKGKRVKESLYNDFPTLTDEMRERIMQELADFEEQKMEYVLIPGVMDFIHYLKQNDYNIGLVTSSDRNKMITAKKRLQFNGLFDVEVVAEDVLVGKPDPSCYLLAAEGLKQPSAACLVFEDSLFGLDAANAAGMKAIAISTTISEEELKAKTDYIIADFTDLKQLKSLFNQTCDF